MKKTLFWTAIAVAITLPLTTAFIPTQAFANEAMIELEAPDDPIQVLLNKYKGKKVSIVLSSGAEIGGAVVDVNFDTITLKEVTGKEVFDAIIRTDQVAAVYLRRETTPK